MWCSLLVSGGLLVLAIVAGLWGLFKSVALQDSGASAAGMSFASAMVYRCQSSDYGKLDCTWKDEPPLARGQPRWSIKDPPGDENTNSTGL